jgi:hypothetical protein
MLLNHAGVNVTELSGDHAHRSSGHCEVRGVRVPEHVKRGGRRNARRLARGGYWALLMRGAPRLAIIAQEDVCVGAVRGPACEQLTSVVSQHDVARLATLGLPNRQCAGVWIEIAAFAAGQLGIATRSQKRGLHQLAEVCWTRADKPLRFVGGQIADHRFVDAFEGGDLAPGSVGGYSARAESTVEGGLQLCLRSKGNLLGWVPAEAPFHLGADVIAVMPHTTVDLRAFFASFLARFLACFAAEFSSMLFTQSGVNLPKRRK